MGTRESGCNACTRSQRNMTGWVRLQGRPVWNSGHHAIHVRGTSFTWSFHGNVASVRADTHLCSPLCLITCHSNFCIIADSQKCVLGPALFGGILSLQAARRGPGPSQWPHASPLGTAESQGQAGRWVHYRSGAWHGERQRGFCLDYFFPRPWVGLVPRSPLASRSSP